MPRKNRLQWSRENKDLLNRQARERYWKSRSYTKKVPYESRRHTLYGLTNSQLIHMWAGQMGKCLICLGLLTDKFNVDHDHQTGRNRGLLCGNCNRGLGLFSDSPERLRSAASYVERSMESRR